MLRKVVQIRVIICLLWLVGAAGGFLVLLNYQTAKGAMGATPSEWPADAKMTLETNQDTLLMFVHPQCPCTRATMEELNRLLARSRGKLAANIYFYKPRSMPDSWVKSVLWQEGEAINGVNMRMDVDGALAKRLGAETSGCVLIYDKHGKLLFRGGITEGRGHAGDNSGESAILAMVNGQPTDLHETAVYGCSLFGECQNPDTKTAQ